MMDHIFLLFWTFYFYQMTKIICKWKVETELNNICIHRNGHAPFVRQLVWQVKTILFSFEFFLFVFSPLFWRLFSYIWWCLVVCSYLRMKCYKLIQSFLCTTGNFHQVESVILLDEPKCTATKSMSRRGILKSSAWKDKTLDSTAPTFLFPFVFSAPLHPASSTWCF